MTTKTFLLVNGTFLELSDFLHKAFAKSSVQDIFRNEFQKVRTLTNYRNEFERGSVTAILRRRNAECLSDFLRRLKEKIIRKSLQKAFVHHPVDIYVEVYE